MPDDKRNDQIAQDLIRVFIRFSRLRLSDGKPGFLKGNQICPEIKHGEMMTLFAIKENEGGFPNGMSVTDLSALLKVKPPTLTPMIGSLEQKGMIDRSMDTDDRRIIRIRMKDKGNAFVQKAADHFISRIRGLVDFLGEPKSIELTALMEDVFRYFTGTPFDKK